jgi:hypothetical protein
MEPRLRALLGNGVDADVAIRLLSRGAPNTVKQYANMWHMFEEWCVREGHQCLPASTATCVLYAGHIAGRGTVRASSMQPYFSAINRVHRDCLGIEEGPASGGLLIRLRQGLAWEQAQTPANPRDTRVALPADVAYLAVVAGLSMAEPHSREQAAELRAVIAVVLGFLCMGRADTIVHIGIRDVVWDASQIIFVLEHEKGRSLRADYRARTLFLSCLFWHIKLTTTEIMFTLSIVGVIALVSIFQTLGLHVPWQGNPKTVGQLAVGPHGACESALAQPFLKPSRRFLSHFTFVRLRRPQSHKARAFTPVVRNFS